MLLERRKRSALVCTIVQHLICSFEDRFIDDPNIAEIGGTAHDVVPRFAFELTPIGDDLKRVVTGHV